MRYSEPQKNFRSSVDIAFIQTLIKRKEGEQYADYRCKHQLVDTHIIFPEEVKKTDPKTAVPVLKAIADIIIMLSDKLNKKK